MSVPETERTWSSEGPAKITPGGLDRLASSLSAMRLLGAATEDVPGKHTFGRFLLRELLGRGKFGVVFRADDPQSNRSVALKLPQPEVLLDPLLGERFRRDAEAAGPLDHPGIVPILESGQIGAVPYLVMEYVPGPSLAVWLARQPGPRSIVEAVTFVLALADAVAYAHEHGVLHCDLKPANILLCPREGEAPSAPGLGDFSPRITDFGLARLLHSDPEQTRTHLTAGTPPYMAPEQALGTRRDLTARCDVHALAAILYELLTGKRPYHAPTVAELVRELIDSDCHPAPPRKLRSDIPRDLEAIVHKGLEKAPEARYASVKEMADDLERFCQGQPTRARPIGPLRRAGRWARRRPGGAMLLAACGALLLLTGGLVYREWHHDQALRLAQQAAELHQFHAELEQVRQRRTEQPEDWLDENLADLRALAASPIAGQYMAELCSEAAAVVSAPRLRHRRHLAPGKNVYVAAFAPDGQTIALGERYPVLPSNELRVWLTRVATGAIERELRYPVDLAWEKRHGNKRADGARSLAYSPEGKWLVLGTRAGRLVRWPLGQRSAGATVWEAQPRGEDHIADEVRSLAFSADGSVFLAGSVGLAIGRWDVRNGWRAAGRYSGQMPVSPASYRDRVPVHVEANPVSIQALDLMTGALRPGPPGSLNCSSFSSSSGGEQFVISRPGRGLVRWQVSAQRPEVLRPLLGKAATDNKTSSRDLAFTGEGGWLITTANEPPVVEAWDVLGGTRAMRAPVAGGSRRLACSPDSRRVAVCEAGRVSLWELVPSEVRLATVQEPHESGDVSISPHGEDLVTISDLPVKRPAEGPGVEVWCELITHYRRAGSRYEPHQQYRVPTTDISRPAVAVTRDHGGPRIVHPLKQGAETKLLTPGGARVPIAQPGDVRFGPDGRLWAAEGGQVLCWSEGGVRRVNTVDTTEDRAGVTLTRVMPTRHGIFAGRRDGVLCWFEARPRLRAKWPVFRDQEITSLAVAEDGSEVLVGGSRGGIVRVALPSGEVRRGRAAPHRDAVTGLAYLSNGGTLSASGDHTIRLWARDDRPLLVLREGGPIARAELVGGRELHVLVKGEWGARRWDLARLHAGLRSLGLAPGWAVVERPFDSAPRARHGVTVELYDDSAFDWFVHRRIDPQITLEASGQPSPWLTSAAWSVRWSGLLQAPRAGRMELHLDADGPATLWLDGRRVFDRAAKETVELPATPVSFRLDYVKGKTGRCRLLWRPAGSALPFAPVPPEAFFMNRSGPPRN